MGRKGELSSHITVSSILCVWKHRLILLMLINSVNSTYTTAVPLVWLLMLLRTTDSLQVCFRLPLPLLLTWCHQLISYSKPFKVTLPSVHISLHISHATWPSASTFPDPLAPQQIAGSFSSGLHWTLPSEATPLREQLPCCPKSAKLCNYDANRAGFCSVCLVVRCGLLHVLLHN